jgi:hypothetical protein
MNTGSHALDLTPSAHTPMKSQSSLCNHTHQRPTLNTRSDSSGSQDGGNAWSRRKTRLNLDEIENGSEDQSSSLAAKSTWKSNLLPRPPLRKPPSPKVKDTSAQPVFRTISFIEPSNSVSHTSSPVTIQLPSSMVAGHSPEPVDAQRPLESNNTPQKAQQERHCSDDGRPQSTLQTFSSRLSSLVGTSNDAPILFTRKISWTAGVESAKRVGSSAGSSIQGIRKAATNSSRDTASSAASSFGRWLGKGLPDLRLIKFAKERRDSMMRKRPKTQNIAVTPRMSSFYPEYEPHILRLPDEHTSSPFAEIIPTNTKKPSSRPERPRLFRSFGRYSSRDSLHSGTETPQDDHLLATTPPIACSPQGLPSPKQRPFFKRKKSSERISLARMEGAQLARSRRKGFSSDNSDTQSPTPSSIKESWLKTRPTPLSRFHSSAQSSAYSPNDTSDMAMNMYATVQSPSKVHQATNPHEHLPSEARRVNTPPQLKTGKVNKLTGYFWDMVSSEGIDFIPGNEYNAPSLMPRISSVSGSGIGHDVIIAEKDWYRARIDRIMDDESPSLDEQEDLEWDIPEHLPNSPLCPLNPKHRGGGKGICVYHGRGPTASGKPRRGDVDVWT